VVPNAAFPLELNTESSTITAYTNAIHPYNNINGNDVESTATATNANANASTTHTDTGMDNVHPSISNNNNINSINNKTIQPTNENGNVRASAVVSAGIPLNNNNNNNVFSREGAMEAFLGKSEARAVVGAAEPYLLLFSNQVCENTDMLFYLQYIQYVLY